MNESVETGSSEPLTVLLVEDDDGDAKAVRRAFAKARVANPITRVCDGLEALKVLRGQVETSLQPPFIILVDINMPRMDGHAFVAELRSDPDLSQHIVFMLTTSCAEDDIEKAYRNHVAGYIVKQNAGRDFLRLVSTLEDHWTLIQKPKATLL